MGSHIPGNTVNPEMGGPQAQNMMESIRERALAMENLPGAGVGNTMNPGMGGGPQAQDMMEQLQYHQGVHEITRALAMANLSGGPGHTPFLGHQNGSEQNRLNADGGSQMSTAPPTPSDTSGSITPPSPSIVANGRQMISPAVAGMAQPPPVATSGLPDVPSNFLTTEFMQSVARTLEDFDTQTLFRSEDAGIDFEEFREWFNPDDLEIR